MQDELKKILEDGMNRIFGSEIPSGSSEKLEKLYDEITLFNPAYKLVAAQGKELVVRHILDCLSPAPLMKKHMSAGAGFADLGSGNGLPGLVLASVFPQMNFTLVERMGRRAGFLRNAAARCSLTSNTRVLEKDLSEVKEIFPFITFRAFRPLADILGDLKRITSAGSVIFIYKSSEENTEIEISAAENSFYCNAESYSVPFLDAERTLLILKRKA